jgi:SAM-dependent methyltransferase
MERPSWAPQDIDLARPSASRIYDYYLGGSHNFEADRVAARQAVELWPELPKIMQTNRAFMRRAVQYAVRSGVTQFLDIGSGIPTFGNVHEVALAASGRARVVYVDNDPVAVAHSRALLTDEPRATVISADLREPERITDHPELRALLDLERPVALMLVAVLHFLVDEAKPHRIVAELRDRLAPGSLLILTHAVRDGRPESAEPLERLYSRIGSPLRIRDRGEIEAFFEGFELVEPGVVYPPLWQPDEPLPDGDPAQSSGLAGVGRKP